MIILFSHLIRLEQLTIKAFHFVKPFSHIIYLGPSWIEREREGERERESGGSLHSAVFQASPHLLQMCVIIKVSKGAKIRNRYN